MLSHIRYSAIDPQWPASLSPKIADTWLRGELGYDGVVMTDDLDMGAVNRHFDIGTAIRQVLEANVDIALICKHSSRIEKAFEEKLRISMESSEMADRSHQSAKRIMRLKKQYLT